MRKAIIYMEVACGHCGGIINRNYKNSTSVKWLKNATSDCYGRLVWDFMEWKW